MPEIHLMRPLSFILITLRYVPHYTYGYLEYAGNVCGKQIYKFI